MHPLNGRPTHYIGRATSGRVSRVSEPPEEPRKRSLMRAHIPVLVLGTGQMGSGMPRLVLREQVRQFQGAGAVVPGGDP